MKHFWTYAGESGTTLRCCVLSRKLHNFVTKLANSCAYVHLIFCIIHVKTGLSHRMHDLIQLFLMKYRYRYQTRK